MLEYSAREIISLCQRFVICHSITEEQDQVCDEEDTDVTEIKQEGSGKDTDVTEIKHKGSSEQVLNFCTFCRKSFANRKLLSVHIYQSHPRKLNYECIPCKKMFAHKFQLTKHSKLCHSKLSFECKFKQCMKLYKSKKALLLHVKNKHS